VTDAVATTDSSAPDTEERPPSLTPILGPAASAYGVWSNSACDVQVGTWLISKQITVGNGHLYAFWSASAQGQVKGPIAASLQVPPLSTEASTGFANNPGKHLALLRRRDSLGHNTRPTQTATIWTKPNTNTETDANDVASLTLVEMGAPTLWHQIANAVGTAGSGSSYVNVPFTCHGGLLLISASATGYSQSGGAMTGMLLTISGGTQIGGIGLYADDAQVHRAFVPQDFVHQLAPGQYTLQATPAPRTAIDGNDGYSISIFEFAGPSSVVGVSTSSGFWTPGVPPGGSLPTPGTPGTTIVASVASSGASTAPAGQMSQIGVNLTVGSQVCPTTISTDETARMCMVPNDLIITNPPATLTWSLAPAQNTVVTKTDLYSVTFLAVASAWS
jgi:hypothetical protein